ncbi:uncharacterized protein LOC117611504 isoform X1 [Osmia lignaria lignaria]|uniref:uncharacterized protein LOC117611504 isoform X1 n=1 Tax=Osmia lignaria lignaria TaxID=1437193 RepID=UPI00402B08E2
MTRVQTVVSFLLCLQCFLYPVSGSTYNIIDLLKGHTVDDETLQVDIDWKCDSNEDCPVPSTHCINGTCQCSTGYVYNGPLTSCLRVATAYGDYCEESIQCSKHLFRGGTCINSTCVCAEGYYYMYGRCNRYSELFGNCLKDVDCHIIGDFEAVSCVDGICKCSPGYYQREYRSCRPETKGVGEKCFINNDCRFNSTAFCDIDNTCALPDKSIHISKSLNDNDVTQNSYSFQKAIGNCTEDKHCERLDAYCDPITRTCTCRRAHFFVEKVGKCIPELGEPCQPTDNAVIEYSECRNGRWHCEIERVATEDNRECAKAIRRYAYSCQSDIQCYIFGPDAICYNEECVCNENSRFDEAELFCWIKKGIGEECQQEVDCYLSDDTTKLSCTKNICSCPNGTIPNSKKTACVETSAGLGKRCEKDNQCVTKNAACVNETCACETYYYELDYECVSGINSNCTNDEECKPENSRCLSNVCSCVEGFVAPSVNLCKPVASFGKPCEEDIQCFAGVSDSICLNKNNSTEDSICGCPEGYHLKLNGCFKRKVLGMKCDNLGECYLDANKNLAVCKNGICSCDWNYIEGNKTMCKLHEEYNIHIHNSSSIANVSTWLLSLLLLISCLFNR